MDLLLFWSNCFWYIWDYPEDNTFKMRILWKLIASQSSECWSLRHTVEDVSICLLRGSVIQGDQPYCLYGDCRHSTQFLPGSLVHMILNLMLRIPQDRNLFSLLHKRDLRSRYDEHQTNLGLSDFKALSCLAAVYCRK